jgi:hypothetical protein
MEHEGQSSVSADKTCTEMLERRPLAEPVCSRFTHYTVSEGRA